VSADAVEDWSSYVMNILWPIQVAGRDSMQIFRYTQHTSKQDMWMIISSSGPFQIQYA